MDIEAVFGLAILFCAAMDRNLLYVAVRFAPSETRSITDHWVPMHTVRQQDLEDIARTLSNARH